MDPEQEQQRRLDSSANRLSKERHLKRLRKILSYTDKSEFLSALWVLDRCREDAAFVLPASFDFPRKELASEAERSAAFHGWEAETLLTELLASPRRKGRRLSNVSSWTLFVELFNSLREAENAEYGARARPGDIFREIRRVGHRQFRWQTSTWNAADSIRWWSIFAMPALADIFKQQNGIALGDFVRLALGWGAALNESPFRRKPTNGRGLGVSADEFNAFIRLTSIPLSEAINRARAITTRHDWIGYRPSPIRDRPVIAFPDLSGAFCRPIEKLYAWRITSGLYYDVIQDSRASGLIGAGFESYIRRLISVAWPRFSDTGDLGYGMRSAPRRAPDVILHRDGAIHVVMECKAKKLPVAAQMTVDAAIPRQQSVDEVAKGVVQLLKFVEDLEAGSIPIQLELRSDAPLVVVCLDEWIFTGPDGKVEIFDAAKKIAIKVGIDPRLVDKRRAVLCTASELDTLISLYPEEVVLDIFRKNNEDKYLEYSAFGVSSECFSQHRLTPRHPLKSEINDLARAFGISLHDLED